MPAKYVLFFINNMVIDINNNGGRFLKTVIYKFLKLKFNINLLIVTIFKVAPTATPIEVPIASPIIPIHFAKIILVTIFVIIDIILFLIGNFVSPNE